MDGTAIVLTGGLLSSIKAKTAHGLVRGTDRFKILAVVDPVEAGKSLEELVKGSTPGIPIFDTLENCLAALETPVDYCIIGIANHGGLLPRSLFPDMKAALKQGISVVSGLHEFLKDQSELSELAAQTGAKLVDVRLPKNREELHFWDGSIQRVQSYKIAVLGIDCAVGKRTTARLVSDKLNAEGVKSEMIFTGQTGWLQGSNYGFIFDSTLNDFVSGELEHAIVSCYDEVKPEVILIEGQAALRNPSGPCGSEYLVSAKADAVILQVIPGRKYFQGWDDLNEEIPAVQDEVNLIKMYGVPTIALTINTENLSAEEALAYKATYQAETGIPTFLPLEAEDLEQLSALVQKKSK